MQTKNEELIIYPSKWKIFGIAFGALIFISLGIILAVYREKLVIDFLLNLKFNQNFSTLLSYCIIFITSYIGVPFFSLCFIYAIYRLIYPKPAIIINNGGIFDNGSSVGIGWIKWDEIEEIFPYEFMGQIFLGIIPKDINMILNRQGIFKKAIMKINKGFVKAPINIPGNILPISINNLINQIKEHYNVKIKNNAYQVNAADPKDCQ